MKPDKKPGIVEVMAFALSLLPMVIAAMAFAVNMLSGPAHPDRGAAPGSLAKSTPDKVPEGIRDAK